jgi:hypothetical protein
VDRYGIEVEKPVDSRNNTIVISSMTLRQMLDQTLLDLARYAKGMRGSLQRKFRMIFFLVRMNSLGRRPQVGRSIEDVEAMALELMRGDDPGFTPELAA